MMRRRPLRALEGTARKANTPRSKLSLSERLLRWSRWWPEESLKLEDAGYEDANTYLATES